MTDRGGPAEPIVVGHYLRWGVHFDREATFTVRISTFRIAVDLRPRAYGDAKKAAELAKKNWPVLERIARAALDSGHVTAKRLKPFQVVYAIADDAFWNLMEKYTAELIRLGVKKVGDCFGGRARCKNRLKGLRTLVSKHARRCSRDSPRTEQNLYRHV